MKKQGHGGQGLSEDSLWVGEHGPVMSAPGAHRAWGAAVGGEGEGKRGTEGPGGTGLQHLSG